MIPTSLAYSPTAANRAHKHVRENRRKMIPALPGGGYEFPSDLILISAQNLYRSTKLAGRFC